MGWVRNIGSDNLRCRTLRHSWIVTTFSRADAPRSSSNHTQFVGRHMICEYCGTVRIDRFGREVRGSMVGVFEKVGTHYVYPTGYQFNSAEGDRPRFGDYQNESLRRELPVELMEELNAG